MFSARIQRYLRSVVASEREPVPAGAFVLYVHPTDPHPFLKYAAGTYLGTWSLHSPKTSSPEPPDFPAHSPRPRQDSNLRPSD